MWKVIIIACFLPSFQQIIGTSIEDAKDMPPEDTTEFDSFSQESSEVIVPTCPAKNSLLTKEDMKTMIDHVTKTRSIYRSINNSYYSEAVAVRNKHMDDFKQFLDWFTQRPEHLKDILEDMKFRRLEIEPMVTNVARVLEEYTQLKENFDKKSEKANVLFTKLNRYKNICEHNCEIERFQKITQPVAFDGYYCSSLEDLYLNIYTKLTAFANEFTSTMHDQTVHDDQMYTEKIDSIKNKLKDVALNEFGRTMYDILNLQDEYHHFIDNINKINAKSEVYNIKETNLQIDTKLLELEYRMERYGTYCRTCNENAVRVVSEKNNEHFIIRGDTENNPENILDHLINLKYIEIQKATNRDYMDLFQELNSLLDNEDSMDLFSAELKPIQNDVIELLQAARANFNSLQKVAPQSSVTKLMNLAFESEQLLANINKEIDNIANSINKVLI